MKEDLARLLLTIPGARKAAQGVIVPTDEGHMHITDAISIPDGMEPEEAELLSFCAKSEIIRLRELRTPDDYLLRLRVNAIARAPRARRVMIARRKKYETVRRRWALTHYYHSMDRPKETYIGFLSKKHQERLNPVPSGFALMDEANAVCVRSILGEVVVTSEALRQFYYFMTIGTYGERVGIQLIDRVTALLIATRIMIGSEALDFDLDPRGSLPARAERSIQQFVDLQIQFTFGHEYAHFLLNHLSTATDTTLSADLAKQKVFSFKAEFEADFGAIELATQKKARVGLINAAYSVLLYLCFLKELTERPEMRRFSLSETHPDPLERIWTLWRTLGTRAQWSGPSIEAAIAAMKQNKEFVLQRMEHAPKDEDWWTCYGSVYLPSYTTSMKVDRLDF